MAYDTPRKREIAKFINKENAKANLKKEGIKFPRQVTPPDEFIDKKGNLVIPEDVSDLSTEDLARYLSVFTALTAYYECIVAEADIDLNTAERVLNYIEDKKLLDLEGSGIGTVTEKKAARNCDSLVMRAQDWKDDCQAKYKMIEAVLKGYENIVFMFSREITRRGNRQQDNGRSRKVSKGESNYQPH